MNKILKTASLFSNVYGGGCIKYTTYIYTYSRGTDDWKINCCKKKSKIYNSCRAIKSFKL